MDDQLKSAEIVGSSGVRAFAEKNYFLILQISDLSLATGLVEKLRLGFENLALKNLSNLRLLVDNAFSQTDGAGLIFGCIVNNVCYLISKGDNLIFLKRGRSLGKILEGEGSCSGIMQTGDLLLLLSKNFKEKISPEAIRTSFDHFSLAELQENLSSLLYQQENTAGAGALLIELQKTGSINDDDNLEETSNGLTNPLKNYFFKTVFQKIGLRFKNLKLFQKKSKEVVSQINSGAVTTEVYGEIESHHHRKQLQIAVILVVLLGASIFLGYQKRSNSQKTVKLKEVYELSLHQYEEAKALKGLNNLRASGLLNEAKTSLDKLEQKNQQVNELKQQIEAEIEAISQVNKVQPEVFFDLNLIKQGAVGSKLVPVNGKLTVLDSVNNAVYEIEQLSKKSRLLAAGDELKNSLAIAADETAVYILTSDGVMEKAKTKDQAAKIIKKDEEWGSLVDLKVFNGNLYLLDGEKKIIWKYEGESFVKKRYFADDDRQPFFIKPISLAIDGSVWVTDSGRVLKFVSGQKENFEIKELEKGLGEDLGIFTTTEVNALYLLDKQNRRIVVLEKNGNYQNQYQWDGHQFTDLAVDGKEKKIYLLEGSKIYQIDIK